MNGNKVKFGDLKSKYNQLAIIIIMAVLCLNIFSIIAVAENPETATIFYIESRFKLWDNTEKMLDESFTIHLIYYNNSNNNTYSYYIQINNDIYKNTTQYHTIIPIHLNNGQIINIFIIKINNETILSESNIRIIGGVSGDGIKRSIEPYTISLSPLQWNNVERNIAFSVVFSGVLSIFLGFRLVKFYRSKNGITIKGD